MIGKSKQCGFTLIELLVAMSVFAVAVTLAMGAYLLMYKAQKKVAAVQNVQSAAAQIVDRISADFQLGEFAYPTAIDSVAITDQNGIQSNYVCGVNDLTVARDGALAESLLPEGVELDKCTFYQAPVVAGSSSQRITIVLSLKSEGVVVPLQTTISSRKYE